MNNSKKPRSSLPSVRRPMPPAARERDENDVGFGVYAKGLAVGLGVYLALGLLLTLVSAAISLVSADPSALILPLSVGAQLVSAFVGGLAASKQVGERPLLCGLLFGAAVILLSLLISLFLPESLGTGSSFIKALGARLPVFLASLLGSAAGSIKKHRHRARRYGYR